MPEYPQEGVLRGGHIPGAKSVPWKRAVNEDGTFKSADELASIYTEACNLKRGRTSSHIAALASVRVIRGLC
jgi:thiosulfate/3-mercaptopyruvate sulfurtransferase